MKSWLRLSGAKTQGTGVGNAHSERRGALAGALLPPLVFALAVICSVAFFASSARAQYTQTNLVSSTKLYNPKTVDRNLIDSWGLAALDNSPWWLSSQNTSTSPLITANGTIEPLLVNIPCATTTSGNGSPSAPCPWPAMGYADEPFNPDSMLLTPIGPFGVFGPVGIVAADITGAFEVNGAPALFIFATQDGLIVAWNESVKPQTLAVVVNNRFSQTAAPMYEGLAIDPASKHLYAADLSKGTVDVFDQTFNLVTSFVPEPNLPITNPAFEPAGPYGTQVIGTKLYVTYLTLRTTGGRGGILDVCNLATSSTKPPCSRLFASNLSGGENAPILSDPWAIALAPKNFGPLSNDLLVGNVFDGLINAFNITTSPAVNVGTLNLNGGGRFSIPGLWGIQFGLGNTNNGPTNNLFFSAGPSPVGTIYSVANIPFTDFVQLYGAGLFGVIKPAS
jgi:uncharacterized protein (TIGR03118 family)